VNKNAKTYHPKPAIKLNNINAVMSYHVHEWMIEFN